MAQRKDKVVYYNGIGFAPVSARMSIVISAPAEVVWATVSKFGKQALWMGSVEGQHIFTELLGGHTVDYVGAVRVFGISDKLIFEQLTRLDHQKMIMSWQGVSHPMNSNPFPASFLNFKGQFQLSRVFIPGKQTFMDWKMDLLTEVHAVDYMRDSMNGIMRVGMLNLQKYLATGGHPSTSLEMQIKPPEIYGISKIPQPASAAMLLQRDLRNDQSGAASMMYAHQTYVPAPVQQSAPILSVDRMSTTALNLEQTVPLLHEAHTAKDILVGAYQSVQHQAPRGASMLQPRVPTSHSMPSASSAQQPQQRSSHALPSDWQQQQQLSQQMYAQRQRTIASQAASQHPSGNMAAHGHSAASMSQIAPGSSSMMSMLSPQLPPTQSASVGQSSQLVRASSQPMPGPSLLQVPSGVPRVSSGGQLSDPASRDSTQRQGMAGAQTRSDVSEQMTTIGGMDNLSLSDVPRDRLKRSANSFSHKSVQR